MRHLHNLILQLDAPQRMLTFPTSSSWGSFQNACSGGGDARFKKSVTKKELGRSWEIFKELRDLLGATTGMGRLSDWLPDEVRKL